MYDNNNFIITILSLAVYAALVVYTTLVALLATYSIASAIAGGAISLYIYNTNTIYINKLREVYCFNSIILFSNNYTI